MSHVLKYVTSTGSLGFDDNGKRCGSNFGRYPVHETKVVGQNVRRNDESLLNDVCLIRVLSFANSINSGRNKNSVGIVVVPV